jgi:hypothetical protein
MQPPPRGTQQIKVKKPPNAEICLRDQLGQAIF